MYNTVESIVAEHFGIAHEEIRLSGRGLSRTVTDARHFTWFILHSVLGYKGRSIAYEYSTTRRNVMYANATIREGLMVDDPFFANHCRALLECLKTNDII